MFRLGFRFALAGIFVACSLPLLAVSLIVAVLATAGAVPIAFLRKRNRAIDTHHSASWSADQFAFERAVGAYEDVIDEHAGSRP